MEVASKFLDRAIDFVLDVSIRHLGYIICYKRHVGELEENGAGLAKDIAVVEHQIDHATNNVEVIEPLVEDWFKKAGIKLEESKEFPKDTSHSKTGCSRGILPFLWYRHRLGRKAKKMSMEIQQLRDKSKFEKVSYQQNSRSNVLSNDGYVEFGSRNETMKKIMEQLKDSTVRMIGVHGPGGVGKTTFVKEIAKKARVSKQFDVVIIVHVTRNPNHKKIQEEIAYHLGMTFQGEGENGRADRLRKRLKQEKEKILIILDDLWDKLDLNMLGMSFDDGDLGHVTVKDKKDFGHKMKGKERGPSDYDGEKEFSYKMEKNKQSHLVYKRCKILLTSRVREVLFDKMNVKENSIFCVRSLHNKEAMVLFKKVAEIPAEISKSKVENVIKYCAGLPMAILLVGMALRNKSESVWEYALEKLKNEELVGVQKFAEISVKMSCDHLETEELKSIFFLCAQMCHEPLIVDLVKYCYGLGILKGVHTLKDARDRISNSIPKLKDSSLMLDGDSNDHFNMHDMVRDAALSIAHKDQSIFSLRKNELDEWPDKGELEKCTAISIYKSVIVDGLLKVINCPQLRVFHIDNDDPSLKIPDSFFERMENLRVLVLTGIRLASLPSSIKYLSNLRMLCLERCDLGNLSIIGGLKKLRILSLSGSKIEDWSAELRGLSKLQLLDISGCTIDNLTPPYFISSLTSLEELNIRDSLIKMVVERETNQISFLSQLKLLYELKTIDVCISSANVFPTNLFFDKLDDYKIVIGDFGTFSIGDFRMPNKYEASRSLALQLEAGLDIHSLKGVKMLFKRVENLLLGELHGVQNVVCELNLDGFPDLKILSIINDKDIECIVNSMELSHPLDVFPKLESLSLFNLSKIEKICCSPVTDGSFSRLKTIKVKACTKLKSLFSFYIIKFLVNLETIDVSECDQLKEIFDEREVSEKIKFGGLRSLALQDLESLTSFVMQARHTDQTENEQNLPLFGEEVEIPELESLYLSSIEIHKIWRDQLLSFSFQNLIKLAVEYCCNLTYLCSLSVASNLKKLKRLLVSKCKKMETLFTVESRDSNDYSKECIFPKLKEIQLMDMDMLKDIWPTEVNAGSFLNLISVHIERCRNLEKIFPSRMQGRYRHLDSLKVIYCESVKVIFEIISTSQKDASDDTKLQLIDLADLRNLEEVWKIDPEVVKFTNLQSISVSSCPKLSCVFPSSVAKGLAKLEDFSIQSCDQMEEIVAGLGTNNEPLVFKEITTLRFYNLRKIKGFYNGTQTIDCPKLKRLKVNRCPELKLFTTESTNEEGRTIFLAEKVISNLEYLEIGQKEAEWLERNIRKYGMYRLKQLCLKSVKSVQILYWLLHRIPNLERLELSDDWDSADFSIRKLVPSGNTETQQRLGVVWQLKELTLSISSIEDIGFERDPLLERLERLVICYCDSLINLANHTVSFTQLTYLEVRGCCKLKKLMASSTAKSLVRLTTMKVMYCSGLEEIVTDDDEVNEEERVADNAITFGKLITIELVGLANLTSFGSHRNCDFSFPSLEKLIFRGCPEMTTFNQSRSEAPKLQNGLVVDGRKWYCDGDLHATINQVYAQGGGWITKDEEL